MLSGSTSQLKVADEKKSVFVGLCVLYSLDAFRIEVSTSQIKVDNEKE